MSKGRDANPKIVIPSLPLTKAKCLATPSNWLLLFLIIIYGRYNESRVRKTKMRKKDKTSNPGEAPDLGPPDGATPEGSSEGDEHNGEESDEEGKVLVVIILLLVIVLVLVILSSLIL